MLGDVDVDESEREFLNVRETARRFGVHENTIRNWARGGILESAQVPGSRYLRFDARDVERLVRSRGEAIAPVGEERRTIGPELVDATQLDQWAGTEDAPHRFPELMRRLLASTPGITNIAVRAGKGVSASGWDGRADSEGASYLPEGSLCFEFSVESRPKVKAEKDFRNRRGVENAKESIFVFATPRRWAGAEKWVNEKRAEGIFADVRVLDADDIEGWLQQTPAVHQWISEQLGRRPQHVETLEQWWRRFQDRTKPALPNALFLAGRTQASERLAKFLGERPEVVAVQAAWRDDAIAFIYATIEKMGQEGHSPQPPLVVTSEEVWNRLVGQPGRMTLLPTFDGANVSAAIEQGHHVVVPLGWEQVVRGEHIHLPRPGREAATKALEAAGLDSNAAYRLAAQARRSMPSLVRKLARDPAFARPAWSQRPDASTFAPLVLVGAWEATEKDLEIVSRVVGKSWPTIERDLVHWRTAGDPPFVRPASQWHVASADEAFFLLRDALTATDLARWHEAVSDVLLELDPKLKLEPNDRPMASLRGAVRKHSTVLRQGLAQGIALLGSIASGDPLADEETGVDHARTAVRDILGRANADPSGMIWCSLSEELRLLAEAAPEEFLDAVHADLDRAEPVLRTTFQDGEQTSALFSSSPHTGLLWALEVLCWSPEHLPDAARALARLAAIDPGGNLSNRPLGSLASVLVGWIPHTSASVGVKVQALEQISSEQPKVGWELLLELWPSEHAISSPPASPRFHDWKPESQNVLAADWVEFIGQLVRLAIQLAGRDAKRWAKLSESFGPLPPAERERLLDALEQFVDQPALPSGDRLELWERIDREIARHRRFPSSDWSMEDEPLSRMQALADRLEPKTDVARFAYLFDWHPDLPNLELGDEGYEEKLGKLRVDAVKETLDNASLDGLQSLAERSAAPGQLGLAVGEVADDDLSGSLLEWLDSDKAALKQVAQSWAACKIRKHGIPWLQKTWMRPSAQDLERRTVLALSAPAMGDLWDVLDETGAELVNAYWAAMNPWRVAEADAERATQELLRHDRPWAAIDMLTATLHGKKGKSAAISTELIEKALDAALKYDASDSPSQAPGYEVGVLLDFLESKGYPLEKLARYEFAFFPALEQGRRRPKALYGLLASDPSIFVDLVSRVYRGKNEPRRKLNAEEEALAQQAWRVLTHWRGLPGRGDDGAIDSAHLTDWVRSARLAFAESNRADIGDEQIGAVLSSSPEGHDGNWPAEPVREIIEDIGSTSLETGIHTGVVNSRGVTTRGVYDGGRQERQLARRYRDWSKDTASKWPRTSRVLRSLADTYERDARHHDARAEITADTE